MVVTIWLDPTSPATAEHLKAWEDGKFGAIFSAGRVSHENSAIIPEDDDYASDQAASSYTHERDSAEPQNHYWAKDRDQRSGIPRYMLHGSSFADEQYDAPEQGSDEDFSSHSQHQRDDLYGDGDEDMEDVGFNSQEKSKHRYDR